MKPTPACPKCRKKNCTDPTHKRESRPFANAPDNRKAGRTYAEKKRRKAAVDEHRFWNGDWCPRCKRSPVKLTADHVVPVAMGGSEDGELQVICLDCQRSQGARVANARRRR